MYLSVDHSECGLRLAAFDSSLRIGIASIPPHGVTRDDLTNAEWSA